MASLSVDTAPAAWPAPARERGAPAVTRRARPRWLALDLFRFLAVLSMVQGHTFFVTMADRVRDEPWYRWHAYVHGYTAPVFLFAAGLAFGIATFPRWERHIRWGGETRARFARYATLLLIGYLLQLPALDVSVLWRSADPALVARILKVDALQHIAVTLAITQALVALARTPRRFAIAVAGLGAASTLAAPALWRAQPELPVALAAYVNDATGSIFPLAPWSAFLFAGILVAYGILHLQVNRTVADVAAALAVLGGVLLAVAFALDHAGASALFGPHNFWKTSPIFFLWRFGVVTLLLAALGLVDVALERAERARRSLRPLEALGQKSLVVYVTHLLVLYGSPLGPGLVHVARRAFGLGGSLAAFAGVWVVAAGVGLGWWWLERHHPATLRRIQRALWALVVILMLARLG